MKKFLAVLFSGIMLLMSLCGCGKDESSSSQAELVCKRAGEEKYGYIDIPEEWEPYTDDSLADQKLIQYSDSQGLGIVTLQYVKDTDAQSFTLNLWGMLEESVQEPTSAVIEINGVKTYHLYGYVPDIQKIMGCWVLDDEKGVTHCITIECAESRYFELADTYRFDE